MLESNASRHDFRLNQTSAGPVGFCIRADDPGVFFVVSSPDGGIWAHWRPGPVALFLTPQEYTVSVWPSARAQGPLGYSVDVQPLPIEPIAAAQHGAVAIETARWFGFELDAKATVDISVNATEPAGRALDARLLRGDGSHGAFLRSPGESHWHPDASGSGARHPHAGEWMVEELEEGAYILEVSVDRPLDVVVTFSVAPA